MKINFEQTDQNQTVNLPKAGTYNFTVIRAKEMVSKRGNEMLEIYLKLREFDMGFVIDYLPENHPTKLKSFLGAIGASHLLAKEELAPEDIINYEGKAEIVIEDNNYGKRAVVTKYVI